MSHAKRLALVRSANELTALTGGNTFLSTLFEGVDGWYYDAIGDEMFHVKKIGETMLGGDVAPVYQIEFSDRKQVGALKDHGFNELIEADEKIKWQVTTQLKGYSARTLGVFDNKRQADAALKDALKNRNVYGHITQLIIGRGDK